MAIIEKTIKVHTITARATGSNGKNYDGTIAFGANSWAALDEEQHEHGREAAKAVAHREVEKAGIEVVGEVVIISEDDETLDVEIEDGQ